MTRKKRLIYLPLGGSGEIGMNMYVYGYGKPGLEEYIMIDAGVTFPDMATSPGVDLIMPDIKFIERNKERLLGIFITHAHEDHIGALGYLIEQLEAPIFCRDFSARIAVSKLNKVGNDGDRVQVIGQFPEKITLNPFEVSFIPVAHSIPEASFLVIDTPKGRIVHTGDFKIDKTPVLGDSFDQTLLGNLKNPDVLALVCDSTNVFIENSGRSESSLISNITSLIKSQKGVVVATTFASNVARLLTLARCAQSSGRSVLVIGRAMQTMISTASSVGLLKNFPSTITVEEALTIPRSNLFILATGSQGEGRAASAQLAREKYMDIVLTEGDTFLFSSKTIPGNEVIVNQVINNFVERGISVIDEENGRYHVSGHANRPDLIFLHQLLKPKLIIPMHGEMRHLFEHKRLAEAGGFSSVVVPNGSVLEISKGGRAEIVEDVSSGRIYYDGGRLINQVDNVIKTRIQMASRGHLSVSLLLEKNSIMENGIWVKSKGLPKFLNEEIEFNFALEEALEIELLSISQNNLYDDNLLEGHIKRVCNKVCQKSLGKKPVITIFINRID
tara:strand:- start:2819 stop:4492 length:1674 start_codon:yes stop_codon:yes gene_type:complete